MSKRKKLYSTTEGHTVNRPHFRPVTQEQADAYAACQKNDITFLTGPAGCSKTYTAIACAIDYILSHEGKKLILTRPAVEACGEEIGAIPGGIIEKMSPFLHPLTDTIKEYAPDQKIASEIVAMAYLRGRTLKNTVLVVDEAQNANIRQMRLLLTRIGIGSKLIMCGDIEQADIRDSGLFRAATLLSGIDGIQHFHFSSIASSVRHPLIPLILERLGPD
jgi:phosphate starvation-inducible PhoH-like protein